MTKAADDEVRRVARENAQRWRGALDLMADGPDPLPEATWSTPEELSEMSVRAMEATDMTVFAEDTFEAGAETWPKL